jgi:hypothetical protein
MGINYPAGIDEGLYIETILTQVRQESLPQEIFDALSSNVINPTADTPIQIPNEVYLKIQATPTSVRTVKVPFRKAYSGEPNLGSNADPRLTEEDAVLKFWTIRYTDLSKTTSNQNYGIGAIEKKAFNVFEYRVEGMGVWYKEYFGKMRRQTLLQRRSENLEDAPHFLTTGDFTPNWFVPNLSASQQPVYTSDQQDWVDTIAEALHLAGTGINACASLGYFQDLEAYARYELLITPLIHPDGSDGYVVILPEPQSRWMRKVIQDGNVGYLFTSSASFSADFLKRYPNSIGRFGGLVFVEDGRYPTLTIGGSASNSASFKSDGTADYTITAQYRGCGNADDGSSDPRDKTATARQVGFLLGQAAIGEIMPEDFHWEYDYEMYDKYFGSGIFCSIGMEMPCFDITDGDSTTLQQISSIALPFAVPPTGYYYTQAA